MNFFAHQEQARRQTRRMLVLFALAVVVIVAAIDLVLLVALGADAHNAQGIRAGGVLAISLFVLLVIGCGSLYRIATLSGGGVAVARQLGAVPVPADTTDFAWRRLHNVVEEIAIASGVPVPAVYVLEEEACINAFAAGYAPTDAAITVTRGALDKLTRAELQGVIAHEFSHVLNGDMRLNIRLMGVVFGILVIATIGRKIAQLAGRGRSRDIGGVVAFGLALFVVGYLGVVGARLIKAAISRQREFLADASAVQFTRQTEGIAGALKKIGALAEGSKLASADKEEVAHMLFGDGVGYSALFATHPPLRARIQRLDPAFRADELKAIAAAWSQPVPASEDDDSADVSIAGFAPVARIRPVASVAGAALPAADARLSLSPPRVAAPVGNPGHDDRRAAQGLRGAIPPPLREAARAPAQAMSLVYALLLSQEPEVRARQLDLVASRRDGATRDRVDGLFAALADLHPMQRLPLASLAFPALRRRPRPQLAAFTALLDQLIGADDRITLGEYCLARLVKLQVIEALDPGAVRMTGRVKLPTVAAELRDVLAIVARHGHDDEASARRAFALGLHEALPGSAIAYAPPPVWMSALDQALPRLDWLAPAGKELVIRALTRAIGADGVVSVAEAELLRTICAGLHCPLPPLLQQ